MNKRLIRIGLCMVIGLLFGSAVLAGSVYPLNTDVTLTYWMELDQNVALVAKNMGDTPFGKELEKRTGVKLKFIHPALGQTQEAFNLLLASGELPDIIEYNWLAVPGGPNSIIKNGLIVTLNPLINQYAPNLKSFLKSHPSFDRMIKTDEGNYFVFPFIRGDQSLLISAGPMVRKDWLDELGLKVPETIDDWYVMLKAFKEKKGVPMPLTVENNPTQRLNYMFGGGFNSFNGFYVAKNKIHYGGIEPNRKLYLAAMNKWFTEGLIDPNFMVAARKNVDANILSNKAGATYGSAGSGIGRYLDAMKGKDAKFNLVAAPFPAPAKGAKCHFAYAGQYFGGITGNAAISAKCKHPDLAARVLDYGYSPEGSLLYNFGIEGQTYTLVNGNPKMTELVRKNPEGLSNTQVLAKYARSTYSGPFVQDKRYIEQYYEYPQQNDAVEQWQKNDYLQYMLPPLTPTPDESTQLAKIMNEINTYQDEMTVKFIMGTEPLKNFDQYVSVVQKMGIDRAIGLYQIALVRYNKRR